MTKRLSKNPSTNLTSKFTVSLLKNHPHIGSTEQIYLFSKFVFVIL